MFQCRAEKRSELFFLKNIETQKIPSQQDETAARTEVVRNISDTACVHTSLSFSFSRFLPLDPRYLSPACVRNCSVQCWCSVHSTAGAVQVWSSGGVRVRKTGFQRFQKEVDVRGTNQYVPGFLPMKIHDRYKIQTTNMPKLRPRIALSAPKRGNQRSRGNCPGA